MKQTTAKVHLNRNIYKSNITATFRIFPGDPTGSPDDFFLENYLNLDENF